MKRKEGTLRVQRIGTQRPADWAVLEWCLYEVGGGGEWVEVEDFPSRELARDYVRERKAYNASPSVMAAKEMLPK